jgi:uncharacterized membrane protein
VKHLLVLARKSFLTGLLLVLPLVVTLWVLFVGIKLLVSITAPAVRLAFAEMEAVPPRGFSETLSLLLAALGLMILGLLVRSYIGRQIWRAFEALLLRVPLANPIYSATKKLMDALQQQKGFQRVVLVEYPRKGCWGVGFITGDSTGDLRERYGEPVFNVFVPTTPNPTSGYLLVVPVSDLIELDMTIEEGITFVMSGGVLSPVIRFKSAPALAQ